MGEINTWTVSYKAQEAQSFIFFPISAHSLVDLILNYSSKHQKVLTTWKCMSPALVFSPEPQTHISKCLSDISTWKANKHHRFAHPKWNSWSSHICMPFPSQKITIPFFRLLSLLFFLTPPLIEQEILLAIIFEIYPQFDCFSPLTLQLPWSKPSSLITSRTAMVSNWPPWICLWHLQTMVITAARVYHVRSLTKGSPVSQGNAHIRTVARRPYSSVTHTLPFSYNLVITSVLLTLLKLYWLPWMCFLNMPGMLLPWRFLKIWFFSCLDHSPSRYLHG